MSSITANISTVKIHERVLRDTEHFLRTVGAKGFEGMVFWVAKTVSTTEAIVYKAYIPPEQYGLRSKDGVAVILPPEGHSNFIASLGSGDIGLVKLHSHPRQAYLSPTDLANPAFCFEGAFNIVIPEYCRHTLNSLTHCSVNRFINRRWKQLTEYEISTIFGSRGGQ